MWAELPRPPLLITHQLLLRTHFSSVVKLRKIEKVREKAQAAAKAKERAVENIT